MRLQQMAFECLFSLKHLLFTAQVPLEPLIPFPANRLPPDLPSRVFQCKVRDFRGAIPEEAQGMMVVLADEILKARPNYCVRQQPEFVNVMTGEIVWASNSSWDPKTSLSIRLEQRAEEDREALLSITFLWVRSEDRATLEGSAPLNDPDARVG